MANSNEANAGDVGMIGV